MLKLANVTAVVGKIRGSDGSAYRQYIENLVGWCIENNLQLNVQWLRQSKLLLILGK